MRVLAILFKFFGSVFPFIKGKIGAFDKSMRRFYRPRLLALAGLAVIAVTMIISLFIPPYLGLSNDGSLDSVIADAGLSRVDENAEQYFSYYERQYIIDPDVYRPGTTPKPLMIVVRAAIWLDELIAPDGVFDMRFLAAIYMTAYLALLYPALEGLLKSTESYTAGLIMLIFSALVFGDTTITVRFASFYTAPLEMIFLLVLLDAALYIPLHAGSLGLLLLPAAASVGLMSLNRYCIAAGPVFAMVYWMVAARGKDNIARLVCILLALVICFVSVTGAVKLSGSQTAEEKYDQMTRGVLYEAEDPEKALAFFGIEPRYTVLTDTYSSESYPVVLVSSGVLDEGFLDKYDTPTVLLYYVTHPISLIALFDIGVHDGFLTRSDYSGNYEQSWGLPARAKALFVSLWSTFKERTAPKTAGLVLLMMGCLVYFRIRENKKRKNEAASVFTGFMTALFGFAILELMTVTVMSGDSELIRESFIMSFTTDITCVLFAAELLHGTKSVGTEGT